MRRVLFVLMLLGAVLGGTLGGVAVWAYGQFMQPGPQDTPTVLLIPKGVGVERIATMLADAGIIKNPLIFRLGVRYFKAGASLRAGEYVFPANVSPKGAMEILQSAKTVVRRITIVEGLGSAEIVRRVALADGLSGDIPLPPKEGVFLPETYHYSVEDTRIGVLSRMEQAMQQVLAEEWAARDDGLPFATPQDALILASIVEKETGSASERAHVAGVFINRLRKGMRLQSDPTVVYAVSGGPEPLGRGLTQSELKIDSPFNTYLVKGLPPEPICNPGRASIHAVMHPKQTKDLYFVANGEGGHLFAATLKEHNKNVAAWRKIERSRQQAQ